MGGQIDADAPLDYASIQIFPKQNRYEVFVCADNEVEKLATGLLEQLSPHLPDVNNLYAKGSNAILKLQVTEGLSDVAWFTKSTLNRFLQIVCSPDSVTTGKIIEGEISQLEETRNFHLSLYAQGRGVHSESEETGVSNSVETAQAFKPEVNIVSSDTSKNELLQALDSRLTALTGELSAAVNQAAGATCSSKEIIDIVSFCGFFRATDLKNSFCKFLKIIQKSEMDVLLNDDKHSDVCMSRIENLSGTSRDAQVSRAVYSLTPVKYGVSPAMVAQIERQSSTESEESSDSSDENQRSTNRNRALARSAPPRRSASPMRRIQIGRTGSRRATALTIKSLGQYPARERTSSHRDISANGSEDEGAEQPSEKPENNVRRMTVQDAINLFEGKQKDQTDIHTRHSSSNLSVCKSKSVLRRWSSGVTECSAPFQSEIISGDSVQLYCNDAGDTEISKHSVEKLEPRSTPGCQNPVETPKVGGELERAEKAYYPVNIDANIVTLTRAQESGRSEASADWSQQKEVELSKMMSKMVQSHPVKTCKPQASKMQNIHSEQRGGFYDQYKERRNEKLRGEHNGKRAEKEAQLKAMQQILHQREVEIASTNVKNISKKHPSHKYQQSIKNPSQPKNPRNERPKASIAKVVPSKSSAISNQKSWPSKSTTRVVESSPSKHPAGISSAGIVPARKKPQSKSSLPLLSTKIEGSKPNHRNAKEVHADAGGDLKGVKGKMQQTSRKSAKTTKTKTAAVVGDCSGMVPSKPSLYNKVTKKSSVMPVEGKPFLRKGSGNGTAVRPALNKTRHSHQSKDSSINCENKIETEDNEKLVNAYAQVTEHHDRDSASIVHYDTMVDSESLVNIHQNFGQVENFNEFSTEGSEGFKDEVFVSAKPQSHEEPTISLNAWVEIEGQQGIPNSYDYNSSHVALPVNVAPVGSPHIRHSLSEMLQEDSSEPETTEWGHAENPPEAMCQKDSPRGFKKLLKFARKSRGDANIAGWSSPSVFSEGEDDAEESKAVRKRNTEALLKKAALRSKNNEQKESSLVVGYRTNRDAHQIFSDPSNISKFNAESSHKLHERHVTPVACTTRATRSFFSLSAFRSSKSNETK